MKFVPNSQYKKYAALAGVFLILLFGVYALGRFHGNNGENGSILVGNIGEALNNVFTEETDEDNLETIVKIDGSDAEIDTTFLNDEVSENFAELNDDNEVLEDDVEVEDKFNTDEIVELCQYHTNKYPIGNNIIINEVAWMGSEDSSTDEWIELKNKSSGIVTIHNWQLIDKNGQIHIVFKDTLIDDNGFLLLERSDDDSAPSVTADLIYSGSIGNGNEGLRLFDESCILIDEALANPDWPSGDNELKRTMQRDNDLGWSTYGGNINGGVFGTPKAPNGQPYIYSVEEEDEVILENPLEEPNNTIQLDTKEEEIISPPPPPKDEELLIDFSNLLIVNVIYDVEGADGGNERINIKNNGVSIVDLSNWSIQYLPGGAEFSTIRKKNFEDGNIILAGGEFIIGANCHPNSVNPTPCIGVDMSWSQALGNESGTVYLVADKEKITGDNDSDIVSKYNY